MKKSIYIGILTLLISCINISVYSQNFYGGEYIGLNIRYTDINKLIELPRLDSVYAIKDGANYRHFFTYNQDGIISKTQTDIFDVDLNIWITIANQDINFVSDSNYTINSNLRNYYTSPTGIKFYGNDYFYERGDSIKNDTIICYSNIYIYDTVSEKLIPESLFTNKYYNGLRVERNDYFSHQGNFPSINTQTYEYNNLNKVIREVSEGYNTNGTDTLHYIQTYTHEYSIDPNDSNISIEYVESYSVQAWLVSGDTTYLDWNSTNRIDNTTHNIDQTFVNNITGTISIGKMNLDTKFYNDDNTIDREVTYSTDSKNILFKLSTIKYVYSNSGKLINILTLGSEYQNYPVQYTATYDYNFSGYIQHYSKIRNATNQITEETWYYLGIPTAQEISIQDFQTITVTFNKELDNSVQIKNYLEIESMNVNPLTILSATISNGNQLVIQLSRPIEFGDEFTINSISDLLLTDGRTVPLLIESKSLNDGTEITNSSLQGTADISVLQFADRVEVQSSEDITKVEVIAANGTKISECKGNKIVIIPTETLAIGVYLLKIIDSKGNIKNTKVVVN